MDSRVNKPDNLWSKPLDACSNDAVLGMSPECHGEKTSFFTYQFSIFCIVQLVKSSEAFQARLPDLESGRSARLHRFN